MVLVFILGWPEIPDLGVRNNTHYFEYGLISANVYNQATL